MDTSRKDDPPKEVIGLTLEEARAKLAEGLLPGEDLLFYDLSRFGKPKPAQPSEVEVYEPPREIKHAAPDHSPSEKKADAKVIVADEPFVPVAPVVLPSILSTTTAEIRISDNRIRRAKKTTKEIALSVGLIGFVTLIAWWFLIMEAKSDAHRKPPEDTTSATRPVGAIAVTSAVRPQPASVNVEPRTSSTMKSEQITGSAQTIQTTQNIQPPATEARKPPADGRRPATVSPKSAPFSLPEPSTPAPSPTSSEVNKFLKPDFR